MRVRANISICSGSIQRNDEDADELVCTATTRLDGSPVLTSV